ncbi:cytochrome c-type biogenesis protein CcmH [Haematospirillum sp. H1815]|uniref:cytochrome c-type biogenesis protein n=1 Tax=Haematospirillum sp. H1815 TaxID=2723108 RepID=UPI0014387C24|nr:cytochrome c-type biogenesis protein [Haematospirillum sp. H1815]NKD76976.1 cytochrome c-type biogenesis protein CcmH [Haematospirillum sp. H1815]
MIRRTGYGVAVLLVLLSAGLWNQASAVEPDEMLPDPVLEQRARAISQGLRCVVCQNESIDESNADIARDLRILVRDRLARGDSDDAVVEYVVSRYGRYVLLRPPFDLTTLVLWATPFALLILALVGGWWFLRRQVRPDVAASLPLTPQEKKILARLVAEQDSRE